MSLPPPLSSQTRSRRAALGRRLEALYRTFDRSYLETDPLAFVHRYTSDADREIVGFLAAGLAFGNVKAIQGSLSGLLASLGGSPSSLVDRFDGERDGSRLSGAYHRWIRAADLVALMTVLRRMRDRSGSIGAFFMEGHRPQDDDIGPSLASFSERARALAPGACTPPTGQGRERHRAVSSSGPGGGDSARGAPRGATPTPSSRPGSVASFFPSPRDGSACKRLNLYLRWMVRDGDGLDLGVWRGISRRQLVLPLDTHLARLTRALGLTRRRSPGWRMAVEATRSLALFDPDDPVKYDFSLSRLGILDLCLHGRDPLECRACGPPRVGVKPAGARSRGGVEPMPEARSRTRRRE